MADPHELRQIAEFIRQERADAEVGELGPDTSLIEAGILDSMLLLQLVTFLEDRLGVAIVPEEVTPENFETLASIGQLVEAKRRAAG